MFYDYPQQSCEGDKISRTKSKVCVSVSTNQHQASQYHDVMWNRGFQLSTQHSQHVTCTFQLQLISMEDNGTMTFCDQFNGSIKLKMEATVLYCTTEEHISTWMKWMFTRKIQILIYLVKSKLLLVQTQLLWYPEQWQGFLSIVFV